MMNMELLAVVTPPSIYHIASLDKQGTIIVRVRFKSWPLLNSVVKQCMRSCMFYLMGCIHHSNIPHLKVPQSGVL